MNILKKITTYFSLIALVSTSIFFFGATPHVHAANCTITGVVVGTPAPTTHNTTLRINSSDCATYGAQLVIEEVDTIYNDVVSGGDNENRFMVPLSSTGSTDIVLLPGEYKCDNGGNPDCEIKITITPYTYTNGNKITGTPYVMSSEITYNCATAGNCNQSFLWGWSDPVALANSCQITSAVFDHPKDTGFVGDTDGNTLYVGKSNAIIVNTQHCAGKTIYLSLLNATDSMATSPLTAEKTTLSIADYDAEEIFTNKPVVVPDSEISKFDVTVGSSRCNQRSDGPDCIYYLVAGPTQFESTDNLAGFYFSKGKTSGRLAFECHNLCTDDWAIITSPQTNTATLADNGTVTTSPDCLDSNNKPVDGCYQLYGGLSQMLKGKFNNINSFGDFINALIALAIGIAGIFTVGAIMWDGVTYWRASGEGNTSKMTAVKGRIWKRMLGLLLVLSIYTFLRTINPDLLNLTPRFNSIALNFGASITPQQFQSITGQPLKSPSQYDDQAKTVATSTGSDYCALRVIVQNETQGNAALVGQDENAPYSGVASRRAFVNSGQKYSGATFSPSSNLITDNHFCNDATTKCLGTAPDPNSATLGLDWRFSKGVGLTQITFYPDDYSQFTQQGYVPKLANKNIAPSRTFHFPDGNITISPKDAFDPEKNLEIAAKLWKMGMAQCNNDPQSAFYSYICGACSCQGSFAQTEVAKRTSQYNQCKQQNP